MTFTFSDKEKTDYPALGMCDTCGKRFTQGCEHSNTMEAQQWLAAYAATEQNRDNVEYFLETQKNNQPAAVTAYEAEFVDGFSDPRTPEEKAADAFNEEYNNDATISDIRTGFQQW